MVSQAREDFALLKRASFRPWQDGEPDDPMCGQWLDGAGVYTTNGALVGIIHRSRPELPDPDLFIFGLPGGLQGLRAGLLAGPREQSRDRSPGRSSRRTPATRAAPCGCGRRTRATPRGVVPLLRRGGRRRHPGSQGDIDHDLDDVVTRRRAGARPRPAPAGWVVERELQPGPDVASREQLRRFVADEAWGHHASCTRSHRPRRRPAGRASAATSRCTACRGCASSTPRSSRGSPGFFIVTPIYMVSEKASDVLIDAARRRTSDAPATGSGATPTERTGTRMSSSYRQGLFWRVLVFVSEQVDHRKHWDKLPLAPALAVLVGIRTKLRQQNLYDTGGLPLDGRAERAAVRRQAPHAADLRRQLQRPRRPDDGDGRDEVRAQHAAREHPAGHGRRRARDPQPAGGQPTAADAATSSTPPRA